MLFRSEAEPREAVRSHRLAAPAAAQREAARHAGAELLRGRLCRWNDDYVYEISLLRHDGKVMHVFVSARDGLVIEGAPRGYAQK